MVQEQATIWGMGHRAAKYQGQKLTVCGGQLTHTGKCSQFLTPSLGLKKEREVYRVPIPQMGCRIGLQWTL